MKATGVVAAWDMLVTACAVAVALMILGTVFLITADVAARYFFSSPIGWVFEVTEHVLVCVPFLGMAWLVRSSGHVRIEIVLTMLPEDWQRRLGAFAYALTGLTCGFAAWYAIATTLDHYARGIVTYGIYPIPKYLLIAVIAFGLTLTTVEFLRKAWRVAHGEAA